MTDYVKSTLPCQNIHYMDRNTLSRHVCILFLLLENWVCLVFVWRSCRFSVRCRQAAMGGRIWVVVLMVPCVCAPRWYLCLILLFMKRKFYEGCIISFMIYVLWILCIVFWRIGSTEKVNVCVLYCWWYGLVFALCSVYVTHFDGDWWGLNSSISYTVAVNIFYMWI